MTEPGHTAGVPDPDDARLFLATVFAGLDDRAYIHLWRDSVGAGRTSWYPADAEHLAHAGQQATWFADSGNVYVGGGLAGRDHGKNARLTAASCVGLPGLWVDIDIAHGAHAKDRLPTTVDDARQLLCSLGVEPTVEVFTGHGIHGWWLFAEPERFGDDAQREAGAALLRNWQAGIRMHAASRGWQLDPTADLARLLRVPGTWNRKHDQNRQPFPAVPVRLLTVAGPRHSPADLADALPDRRRLARHVQKPLTVLDGGGDIPKPGSEALDQAALEQLSRDDERFAATWERRRDDLDDNSASGYDLAVAATCIRHGWTDGQVVAALHAWRTQHAERPEKLERADYVSATLGRARKAAWAAEAALPEIIVTNRDLSDITQDAVVAVVAANQATPQLYKAHGALARIQPGEAGRPVIVPLNKDMVAHHLARVARWRKIGRRDGEPVPVPTYPPDTVVRDVAASPDWPIPRLAGIASAPVVDRAGNVHRGPGYVAAVELWIEAVEGLNPEPMPLEQAIALILEHLLGDFPFATLADRAGAVALVLERFVRPLITGLTPCYLVEAPTEGTGKGLLVEAGLWPALGDHPRIMAPGRDDDEMRKRLTGALAEGTDAIVLDNATHVDSPALAAAITGAVWQDRILGLSRTVTIRPLATWVVTGNNPVLSAEIARRCIRIRLDAGVEAPHLRQGWKHDPLLPWVKANRAELVRAVLTLITEWVVVGMPKGTLRMGRFEQWADVMGGILDNAGICGLGDNAAEMRNASVNEGIAWQEFVEKWWTKAATIPMGVGELFDIADGIDGLGITGSNERAARVSFGKVLSRHRDRRVGPWRISHAGKSHGSAVWHLEVVDAVALSERGRFDGPPPTSPDLPRPEQSQF